MKRLLILRHAKSSWRDAGLRDHDRPLNNRGRRDAPQMGARMREEGLSPGLIVSSTAVRARQTAELVAEGCGYTDPIALSPELYHGSTGAYLEAARDAPGDVDTLLLVGHNPGVQEVVWALSRREERMPTAALATIEFGIDKWRDVETEIGNLIGVLRPKELF